MKLKKTLSLIIAIIMIAATFGVIAIPSAAETVAPVSSTGTADTSWYDANSNASTFTISTADQLDGLAKLVNDGTCNFDGKTIKLGADITYNSGIFTVAEDGSPLYNGQPVSETNAPRVWPVIGNTMVTTSWEIPLTDTMFRGNFDGQGYAISGLFVNNNADRTLCAIGLFSNFVGEELVNTSILNSYFCGFANIGSFAGHIENDETRSVFLENLYSDAHLVITSNNKAGRSGGIVGNVFDTFALTVNRCGFEGSITFIGKGTSQARHVGGIIGETRPEHRLEAPEVITNCLVDMTVSIVNTDLTQVTKTEYWGGIIGNCGGNKSTRTKIENVIVKITARNDPATSEFTRSGAIVGVLWYGGWIDISNSYCILPTEQYSRSQVWLYLTNMKTIVDGVETEFTNKGDSNELAKLITAPSEATGLSSETFLLTAEKAAIKDLSACFGGHSFTELYQAKTASCDGEGWNAHYRCNNCSKFFDTSTNEVAKDTVIIPETHNYGTLITGTPATCTENGTIDHYKCSLCNRMFDKDKNQVTDLTILAGHNYGELIRRVKATCVEPGTIAHYQCSVCSKYFNEDKVEVADITTPITDHDYGRWVEAVAPTPNAAGVLGHYKCGECRKYFDADKNELASIEGEPKLTTTKKPDTTKAPTTTAAEEKGCGGFAAVGSLLALIALTGAAVVIKKK